MSGKWKNSIQREIVGTWKLVRAESRADESQKWSPDFGEPTSGYFFYDVNGYTSVQIMTNPPQPKYSTSSPSADEALQIFNNYISYYGTYTLDEDGKTVTCHVEGALDPNQVGTEQPRPCEIKGNRLIIGDQKTWIRVLERVA